MYFEKMVAIFVQAYSPVYVEPEYFELLPIVLNTLKIALKITHKCDNIVH